MNAQTHKELAGFIWKICDRLRGPYRRNEYRKVILPLTVLRRFDCVLAPTRAAVLAEHAAMQGKPDKVIESRLQKVAGLPFYNLSQICFKPHETDANATWKLAGLLDDQNQIAINLNSYINKFSPNVRAIMDRFAFELQIAKMNEKNLLYEVIREFGNIDLSPHRVKDQQMGYVFEELIRIGAEQANEEAGDHFTPREVIRLMVDLLLNPEEDIRRSHVVKTIYDPACGTGGMLSEAEKYIKENNIDAAPILFGQDYNDEAWAVCRSDMLLKGEDADNIVLGDTFKQDGFERNKDGEKWTFDYMLANPPFGVEWKQQQKFIEDERDTLGEHGRFYAGLPRVNDGSLLFLQHMLSKRRPVEKGGSRIAIVFNGSPLFTGDAGSGESDIRKWVIENDWLEAVVALPDQLFYNTGISTYIWILTNRKECGDKPGVPKRTGKVQLVDARPFFIKMRKSLGNKRNEIGDGKEGKPDHIAEIAKIYGNFQDGETRTFVIDGKSKSLVVSKVFDNEDFGYRKITVERPLRMSFVASPRVIEQLEDVAGFLALATSAKKKQAAQLVDIDAGKARQQTLRDFLRAFVATHDGRVFNNREHFIDALHEQAKALEVKLDSIAVKIMLEALGRRDPDADICRDSKGRPEPDPELRDTESVPLKEDVEAYFQREVLPHVPDAWIDHARTKIGYEIPFNRHFYRYEPPRPLEEIEADIKALESDILALLKEVAA
jgi:type I restriction enzyme M protein